MSITISFANLTKTIFEHNLTVEVMREIDHAIQIRLENGAVIDWFLTSKKAVFRGRKMAAKNLFQLVMENLEDECL